jgi:hypothetical protein
MLDKDLLEVLLASDRATDGHPQLPEGSRTLVEEALTGWLVDGAALRDHVRGLQRYFLDARAKVKMTAWRHDEALPEHVERLVLETGPAAFKELDPGTLASLVFNYAALFALSDRIASQMPVAWQKEIAAHGQRLMQRDGAVGFQEIGGV